MSSCNWV